VYHEAWWSEASEDSIRVGSSLTFIEAALRSCDQVLWI
jgi:hypothetical protein